MNPIIEEPHWSRLDPDVLAPYEGTRAAVIGDVMDRIGCMDGGIRCMWEGATCLGSVFPVWTRAGDNAALHRSLELAEPGDVLVVNGQGDLTRALFGELMAMKAQRRGIAGLVVDGAVRDVTEFKRIGFPVFARACTPSGPYKDGPGTIGTSVAVGGVVCNPGDIAVGDDDGVVIVPAGRAVLVAEAARAKEAAEDEVREGRAQLTVIPPR